MTNVFKSEHSARSIEISKSHFGDVALIMSDMRSRDIIVNATEAPALALAILESAGWPEEEKSSVTRTILHDLRFVVDCVAKKANEAADRAALWQEASDLYHSVFPDNPTFATPDQMPEHLRDGWVRAALKAREIHGTGHE